MHGVEWRGLSQPGRNQEGGISLKEDAGPPICWEQVKMQQDQLGYKQEGNLPCYQLMNGGTGVEEVAASLVHVKCREGKNSHGYHRYVQSWLGAEMENPLNVPFRLTYV